jgi:hypothetical protein
MRCSNWRWGLTIVALAVVTLSISAAAPAATIVTFENDQVDPDLGSEDEWHGVDHGGTYSPSWFAAGDYALNSFRDDYWSYWDCFSYSNKTNTGASGLPGQFTAYSADGAGGGAGGSANYGIGYVGFWGWYPQVVAPQEQVFNGGFFTNNAYAYHSMMNGDGFAKKFGGADGTDPDWFKLTIYGLDDSLTRTSTSPSVDFYLADYQFTDNNLDYIVTDWTWVDLTSLGSVWGLEFDLSSSDTGLYGMNTPAYFAMDNLNVPEPSSFVIFGLGGAMALAASRWRRRKSDARLG